LTEQSQHLARLISNVFSPPVIWGVLVFPVSFHFAETPQQALTWALTYSVLVCLLPALFIALLVRRGRITDIHMRVRQQRIWPFLFALTCALLAWAALNMMKAPTMVPMLALATLIQLGVMLLVTLVWQISVHAMSITGAVVFTAALFGPAAGLLLSPLIPVVGASRVLLQRHTISQVVAGGAVGAMLTLLIVMLGVQS